jgi:nicotinamidase-related amidase
MTTLKAIFSNNLFHEDAVIIMDLNRAGCDPAYESEDWVSTGMGFARTLGTQETLEIAERINQVAHACRSFGLGVYHIYYGQGAENHMTANGGLLKVQYLPSSGDKIIRKTEMDPFTSSNFDALMKADGRRRFWVMGFRGPDCITDLGLGALARGYDVKLISDCIGVDVLQTERDKLYALDMLQKKGARILESNDAIKIFQAMCTAKVKQMHTWDPVRIMPQEVMGLTA